ncbi:MAG: hypothetical protein ACKPKO_23715, partial [Candidatus Fonsibacter sp.]
MFALGAHAQRRTEPSTVQTVEGSVRLLRGHQAQAMGAVHMPTRDSDGGENIDCVIHEVGKVMCDKGFRFALSGVCTYQVVRGTLFSCINPLVPKTAPITQFPQ